jgi:hypothetical protein
MSTKTISFIIMFTFRDLLITCNNIIMLYINRHKSSFGQLSQGCTEIRPKGCGFAHSWFHQYFLFTIIALFPCNY